MKEPLSIDLNTGFVHFLGLAFRIDFYDALHFLLKLIQNWLDVSILELLLVTSLPSCSLTPKLDTMFDSDQASH